MEGSESGSDRGDIIIPAEQMNEFFFMDNTEE